MVTNVPNQPDREPPEAPDQAHSAGFFIGPVFFVLAAVMYFGMRATEIPAAATPAFDQSMLAFEPRPAILSDPPTTNIGGFDQRCNACHKLFESTPGASAKLVQHSDLFLNHGINNSCANCHEEEDRERLVMMDGSSIPYAQSALLCRQCHGPVYRDWTHGTHGKTLGSWRVNNENATRLKCTQCHDPHSPRFKGMHPLPGPNTLRMGDPTKGGHHKSDNPLRRWTDKSEHAHEHHEEAH